MRRYIALILWLGAINCERVAVSEPFISDKQEFLSPDKKYTITTSLVSYRLQISNSNTHKLLQEIMFNPPLLEVLWLNDSSAFCTINGFAEGSLLEIHRLNRGSFWETSDIYPPDHPDRYKVVDLKSDYNSAIVTYLTRSEISKQDYLVKLQIYPKTWKIRTLSSTPSG